MMLKVLANIINRNPEALVFGSNTVFFYDLLPYLASHVKIIDLTHSITAKQDWLEVKSLRSVDRYYKRIVLGNSALDEFKKIYLAHQIPLSYAEHFQIIKNKVDIPAQLPVKDCSGDLEILFVARNSPEKRAGLFFEIVRRCKKQNVKANFTIIGEFQEVRRGDYLKEPDLGGIADLPYFERGIAFMKEHLGNPKFYVFSDDISWCREHLPLEQSVFVDWNTGTESYRDMQLISLCKHAIISNSSFSWWGAWLNTNPLKESSFLNNGLNLLTFLKRRVYILKIGLNFNLSITMFSTIKKAFSNTTKQSYLKQSYAQSGEDLLVDFIFNAIGIHKPTYLDIGAHHPYYLNNTAIFYERGCRGINIEPDPILFKEFGISRKEDVNLNIGIGEQEGKLDFYQMSVPTLNTFSKTEAENYTKEGNFEIKNIVPVKVETIHGVLQRHNNGKFPDFLSLDAEGLDDLIIRSMNFEDNCPKIICIETLSFSKNGRGEKNKALIGFLEDNGYLLYADTNINSIFVRQDLWLR